MAVVKTTAEPLGFSEFLTVFCQGLKTCFTSLPRIEENRMFKFIKKHFKRFGEPSRRSSKSYKKIFKIKLKLPLTTMRIIDEHQGKATGSKRSLVLGWPSGSVLATFGSEGLKTKWASFLERYIYEAMKDNPSLSHKNCEPDSGAAAWSTCCPPSPPVQASAQSPATGLPQQHHRPQTGLRWRPWRALFARRLWNPWTRRTDNEGRRRRNTDTSGPGVGGGR
ncbi:hypothetical protein HJG60_008035 [Phyllostomus discolor]|uniref:ARHGAP20 PH domain-containing protein n=1 Tax=Phyllostomus discolor TaxID=89673 RepID=A0A834BI08_9CHIR|nr:hypothetical protein HJG60_008035 [Phyllostomus discolor]